MQCQLSSKLQLTSYITKHPKKNLTLVGDRVNNIDVSSLTCLTTVTSDHWLWHQKLRLELVIGLPKLKFEKDHVCDACQLGNQTRSSFKGKDIVNTSKPLQLFHMDLFGTTRTASI